MLYVTVKISDVILYVTVNMYYNDKRLIVLFSMTEWNWESVRPRPLDQFGRFKRGSAFCCYILMDHWSFGGGSLKKSYLGGFSPLQ